MLWQKVRKKKKKKEEKEKKNKLKNVAYYQIPVNFEITGNFFGYIKFKRNIPFTKDVEF